METTIEYTTENRETISRYLHVHYYVIHHKLQALLLEELSPRSLKVCTVSVVSEWFRLLPLLGILALLGYLTIRPFLPKKKKQRDSLINLKIQKENPKVVNEIDIEDLKSTNVCYCRCWRSKTVCCSSSFLFKQC